ncbi:hypothetical protein FQN57_003148 [Myotisia sp. PD_48]|nr:hypothetical protein FQN57_003148 [Myotisia sp. PD_48]
MPTDEQPAKGSELITRNSQQIVYSNDDDDRSRQKTVLPRPLASLVSLVTHSTSLSFRFWTYVGGYAIDSARATTLTGLELSRAVVEGILIRAGRDVASRSGHEYGRNEAETLLERSLATLHNTITSASFFASASFHFSSVTLSSVSGFSQNLLSTLDAILGSSESSRAIAAIITLIRREFRNPELRRGGEVVGVGDLLVGSIGFVLLQRWGRRKTDRENRQNSDEETIWDIVILDNGLRADVVGSHQSQFINDPDTPETSSIRPSSFMVPDAIDGRENIEIIGRNNSSIDRLDKLVPHLSLPADRQYELSDDDIRLYIMDQLPQGCRATIKTDKVTTRTITVNVFDTRSVDIQPPPGTTKIGETVHSELNTIPGGTDILNDLVPKHTIVFRTGSNHIQDSQMVPSAPPTPVPGSESRKHSGKVWDIPENTLMDSDSSDAGLRLKPRTVPYRRMSSDSLSSGSETPRGSFVKRSPHKSNSNSAERAGNNSPRKISKVAANSFPRTTLVRGNSRNKGGIRASKPHSSEPPPYSGSMKDNPASNQSTRARLTLGGDPTNRIRPLSPQEGKSSRGGKRPDFSRNSSYFDDLSPGSPQTSSHYLIHGKSSETFVAQTDAYSTRPQETQPKHNHSRSRDRIHSSTSLSRTLPEKDLPISSVDISRSGSPAMSRRNSFKSGAPSLYSIATGSDTSLLLAPRPGKSAYDDQAALSSLSRTGHIPGLYPSNNLVQNIRRFSRFSSASYGSNFLRVMGISTGSRKRDQDPMAHYEHSSFSDHTGLPASTILLSSFVDPAGCPSSTGKSDEGFPLVHYLSLDHESKAAVLTLRGTWGFQDILTDMTCDYDDLHWMGQTYQVHKGMLISARRLLEGGGGRVMATIKAALEEFPEYGVIFCGHSLGGGVAALLATLISQPHDLDIPGPLFLTSSHQATAAQTPRNVQQQPGQFCLPPGRPVHAYAYGPPAVMCPSLRLATRGLVTTIVNGQDIVPSLSLGVLHDFHNVSLSFKRDVSDAKSQVKSRIWDAISRSIANKLYMDPPISIHAGDDIGEDSWAWNTLKSLRENLTALKLLPPGEVFIVETMRVLQRDAFARDVCGGDGYPRLGRPATRVQLKYIRDVESRFREIRFGSGMLGDHSPARYEASLSVLARGVLED